MGHKKGNKNCSTGIVQYSNSNAARYLKVLDNYKLQVLFNNGVEKIFDMSSLIKNEKVFSPLVDKTLFKKAQIDEDCFAIIWNEEIDLAIEEVWKKGITTATAFNSLLSMKEATDMWGLEGSTLRKAIQHKRFIIGQDVYKFGKQWVLVKGAIEREYGPCIADQILLIEKELDSYSDPTSMIAQYYSKHPEKHPEFEEIKAELENKLNILRNCK